ncbi:MAG: RluA family pseudouridine synthase [Lachnospirales bacterium]
MQSFKISLEQKNTRIDHFCSDMLPMFSRSNIQKQIENNFITVNYKSVKSNYKLRENDLVKILFLKPKEVEILPVEMPLNILFEDDDIIVIDKEQGVVVHPGNGHQNDTLVNGLMFHTKNTLSGINGELRPGIVHRIDKDTSGIIVIAKNDFAHVHLAKQLEEHTMTRIYSAIVINKVKDLEGTINRPIGRDKNDRKKMCLDQNGRHAVTHYKVIEVLSNATHIECKLETGRTHQIRVHLGSIGHYLLGDATYGSSKQHHKLKGQALHAKKLGFIHPRTEEYMEFNSQLPESMCKLIKKLGGEIFE